MFSESTFRLSSAFLYTTRSSLDLAFKQSVAQSVAQSLFATLTVMGGLTIGIEGQRKESVIRCRVYPRIHGVNDFPSILWSQIRGCRRDVR